MYQFDSVHTPLDNIAMATPELSFDDDLNNKTGSSSDVYGSLPDSSECTILNASLTSSQHSKMSRAFGTPTTKHQNKPRGHSFAGQVRARLTGSFYKKTSSASLKRFDSLESDIDVPFFNDEFQADDFVAPTWSPPKSPRSFAKKSDEVVTLMWMTDSELV